ncbi:MAG: tetratricopeptide repeat protein [Pyrinomonadaceae bacterium]
MKLYQRFRFNRFRATAIICILIAGILVGFSSVSYAQDEEFDQEAEFSQTDPARDDPVALFNRGQDAHSKGELREALTLYQQALKANPDFPEAEFQKGVILKELGNGAEAEKSFKKVISLRSDWALPYYELGLLFAESGDYDLSEKFLSDSLRLDEINFNGYSVLAGVLLRSGSPKMRLEEFLRTLQTITSQKQVPAILWIAKASVERKLGDFDSSIVSAGRALKLAPHDTAALSELTENYIAQEKREAALETANKLLEAAPNSKSAKILLARALHLNEETAKAVAVLESVKTQDDEITGLIKILKANGDISIPALEKMIADDPSNLNALGRLCIATRTTDPKKALEYCERALILDGENITHAIGFGAALVQLRRYREAAAVLTNLLKHSPENYTIHANLATALFQMQNFESAKLEYSWIIKRQPEIAIAYYFLAISHDRLQEYPDALQNYQKFLETADSEENRLEIEKVNLRIPILSNQIKRGLGKKSKGG